ncbi:MAG: phosphoglycerate dehydrogenase [Thermodesulfobacteriota bacterium]|nr:phosphoglycerate dehydrogenase [Thermodesulfobacteriota bacterium]
MLNNTMMTRTPATVLATTSSFGAYASDGEAVLAENGYVLVKNPYGRKLTEAELADLMAEHRPAGLLAGVEPVTAGIIQKSAGFLRTISRVGVGWDNVDRAAAEKHGIPVYRTKGVLDKAVAELTIGLILSALRQIGAHDRAVKDGKWEKQMGGLLSGRTLGIIGYGAIGRRVAALAQAFGALVIYFDPYPPDNSGTGFVPFETVLKTADILCLHAEGSRRILGEKEIQMFAKPGAILVNTARGGLVDETALYHALDSGQIQWACLDVFEQEPYAGPLRQLDNVILTPHIGSYAREARIEMETLAVKNLLAGLNAPAGASG